MRKALTTALVSLSLLCINLALPCMSKAYEYHLQFTPPALPYVKQGPIIGEQINADGTISGSINYYQQYCGYGGCRTPYGVTNLTGHWDAQGNLLGTLSTPWPAQTPLYAVGTEQVYAVSADGLTTAGFDTSAGVYNGSAYRGFGFAARKASHYKWTTDIYEYICGVNYCLDYVTQPSGGYQTVNWTPPTTFVVQLTSDGDLPLNVTSTISQVLISGSGTVGVGKVTSVTGTQVVNPDGTVEAPVGCLGGPIAPGTTCGLAITFDPSTVTAPASTGYGYNFMYFELVSDAGNLPYWSTHFTIAGIPVHNPD